MSIRTREEILHQAAELTRKQDARLAAEHQRSAFLAAGFIPTGALVTALLASPAVNASSSQVVGAAAITLLIIITNSLCWYALHSVTKELKQGPDIGRLRRRFADSIYGYEALLNDLITTISRNYEHNKRSIGRVGKWVNSQAIINVAAVSVLVMIVLQVGDVWPFS